LIGAAIIGACPDIIPCIEPRGSRNNFSYHVIIIQVKSHAETVYGIECNHIIRTASCAVIAGLLFTCVFVAPVLASVSTDVTVPESTAPLEKDNPEFLSALKTHVAYVGQTQDARMEGVISYVDTISDGEGSGDLREIRNDYLAVASTIPIMQTADDVAEARLELQRQSRLFNEETKAKLLFFNGSTKVMREQVSESVQTVEDSIQSFKDSLWLSKDTARISVFNRESQQRAAVLRSLSKQGVDISRALNISQQINAQRVILQKALEDRSLDALKTTNNGLKTMNREFRTTVDEYQNNLRIETKRTAILAMG
jgi:hypothetical protein